MSVLEYELRDRVGIVTLNRPDKLNAINAEMRARFKTLFDEIEQDDSVKVVLVRGAGERAFSAGADLYEAGNRTAFQRRRESEDDPANLIRSCSKPVIAALHGYVLGGGAELATACDMRVAADDAVFGYPEIKHGWLPAGGGGTQSLPRVVGLSRAMIMVLTGENCDAAKAKEIGLVDELVPRAQLEDVSWKLASQIASHRLRALILAKSALRLTERAPMDIGLQYERELSTICYYFEDREEALTAFREKRSAKLSD